MNDFLETIYGVMFYPRETFDELKQNPSVYIAMAVVSVISMLGSFLDVSFSSNAINFWFVFSLIGAVISGIIKWGFFALFVEIIACIFKKGGKFETFLTLSAFALVPWIFMGPVALLKTGGVFFAVIGILFGLIVWVWTTALTLFAIAKTYEISSERVLLLVLVPFLGVVIFFSWTIGFFATLIKIATF